MGCIAWCLFMFVFMYGVEICCILLIRYEFIGIEALAICPYI